MNREQALHYAEILQAIADGKTVQGRCVGGNIVWDWVDMVEGTAFIIDDEYEYRVKPEPKEFWLCWDKVIDEGTPYERINAFAHPIPACSKDDVSDWANVVKVRVIDDE